MYKTSCLDSRRNYFFKISQYRTNRANRANNTVEQHKTYERQKQVKQIPNKIHNQGILVHLL